MPTINDKLAKEQNNERTIRLWPEAMFYKAYERSAYLFVTQVRPYCVRRRYIEATGGDVVSTGFPQSVLAQIDLPRRDEEGGAVVLTVGHPMDEQAFLLWREGVPLAAAGKSVRGARVPGTDVPKTAEQKTAAPKTAAPKTAVQKNAEPAPPAGGSRGLVEQRILSFNLADATPMQCMLFVADLQRQLHDEAR